MGNNTENQQAQTETQGHRYWLDNGKHLGRERDRNKTLVEILRWERKQGTGTKYNNTITGWTDTQQGKQQNIQKTGEKTGGHCKGQETGKTKQNSIQKYKLCTGQNSFIFAQYVNRQSVILQSVVLKCFSVENLFFHLQDHNWTRGSQSFACIFSSWTC